MKKIEKLFPYRPSHVPRTVDLLKLFDTTADLSGGDIDIADWVRGGDELDVYVFWRDQDKEKTPYKKLRPRHEELCPVSIGSFKNNWRDLKKRDAAQIWRQVYNKGWEPLTEDDLIYPGQVFLLNTPCGGYSTTEGWKLEEKSTDPVPPPPLPASSTSVSTDTGSTDDDQHDEDSPEGQWQSIFTHSQKVWKVLRDEILKDPSIANKLTDKEKQALQHTPPWHDYGKAHEKFFAKFNKAKRERWEKLAHPSSSGIWPAKAPQNRWKSNFSYEETPKESELKHKRRPGFRHELASALGLFELLKRASPGHPAVSLPKSQMEELCQVAPHLLPEQAKCEAPNREPLAHKIAAEPDPSTRKNHIQEFFDLLTLSPFTLDLLLYLIASHHGKVRMGLTSTNADHETDPEKNPDPLDPADPQRRIRGVQDGDTLPACRLPAASSGKNSFTTPEITLDLSPAELFSARYGRSWRERTSGLLAVLGPFRLAYLEALIRAADGRGSR